MSFSLPRLFGEPGPGSGAPVSGLSLSEQLSALTGGDPHGPRPAGAPGSGSGPGSGPGPSTARVNPLLPGGSRSMLSGLQQALLPQHLVPTPAAGPGAGSAPEAGDSFFGRIYQSGRRKFDSVVLMSALLLSSAALFVTALFSLPAMFILRPAKPALAFSAASLLFLGALYAGGALSALVAALSSSGGGGGGGGSTSSGPGIRLPGAALGIAYLAITLLTVVFCLTRQSVLLVFPLFVGQILLLGWLVYRVGLGFFMGALKGAASVGRSVLPV
ncbi:hypothetical protein H696_01456 [Fonticula alba]|uniref:Vesicle transport protein n=1 Tax=Fonticula alba TaxID=691883 RepID=A0A058ZDP3_FONAL|nr:hypothetical protein H696_01456 [Fonticula alba]KCV72048.1 hypothetical protein H696_01456 [Fonticula alba]|eukprot:XP_009493626.1 hypothetical protein H696_01456 [Fonticula alba]